MDLMQESGFHFDDGETTIYPQDGNLKEREDWTMGEESSLLTLPDHLSVSKIPIPQPFSFADSSSMNQTFSLEDAVAVDESALDREIVNLEKEISRNRPILEKLTGQSPNEVR